MNYWLVCVCLCSICYFSFHFLSSSLRSLPSQVLTSEPRVRAFLVLIGSLGAQATELARALPPGAFRGPWVVQVLLSLFSFELLPSFSSFSDSPLHLLSRPSVCVPGHAHDSLRRQADLCLNHWPVMRGPGTGKRGGLRGVDGKSVMGKSVFPT